MEIKYGGYRKRHINDIIPSGAANGFDVRRPAVRHQSIGQLDDAYLRSRHLAAGTRSTFGYTYVPPLESLYARKDRYADKLRSILAASKSKLNSTGIALLTLGTAALKSLSSVIEPITSRLPKRYTLRRGLQTNWNTPVLNGLKLIIPAVLILVGAALLLPGQREQPITVSNDGHNSNKSDGKNTTQNTGGKGEGPAGSASQTAESQAPGVAPSTGLSGAYSAGRGGYGGGSAGGSTPPSSEGSSTPTTSDSGGGAIGPALPINETICTPSVQTKPLSTSGTCATIN